MCVWPQVPWSWHATTYCWAHREHFLVAAPRALCPRPVLQVCDTQHTAVLALAFSSAAVCEELFFVHCLRPMTGVRPDTPWCPIAFCSRDSPMRAHAAPAVFVRLMLIPVSAPRMFRWPTLSSSPMIGSSGAPLWLIRPPPFAPFGDSVLRAERWQ